MDRAVQPSSCREEHREIEKTWGYLKTVLKGLFCCGPFGRPAKRSFADL